MRINFFLTAIFFAVLAIGVSYTSSKVFAAKGCCNGAAIDITKDKKCVSYSAADVLTVCGSRVRECDMAKDVTDEDLDGDGTPNVYNRDCFVNIKVPEQVKITDFGKLFTGAVSLLLLVAFILAFLYLILGGIAWVTSGGDKAGIEAARNKIINALIGLIVVASTWAIFQLVGGAIGFNILGGFTIPTFF